MLTFKIVQLTAKNDRLVDETYPIKLQATQRIGRGKYRTNRKSLRMSALLHQWDDKKARVKKNHFLHQQLNEELDYVEEFARHVLFNAKLQRETLSLDEFLDRVVDTGAKDEVTVYDFFTERMEEVSVGNRKFYKHTRDILPQFAGDGLVFSQITADFLRDFEKWLRDPPKDSHRRGCNDGGVGTHIRTLSALYNEAEDRELFAPRRNPFKGKGRKSYNKSKLKPKIDPNPLSQEEWKLWVSHKPTNEKHKFWHDVSLFMYYNVGQRFSDVCLFKREFIKGDWVNFYMKKTGKQISYPLHPKAKEIADIYNGDDYLFPIMSSFHETDQQKLWRREKKAKQSNKVWKEIAKELGIQRKVTSKTFRYTFVYNAKMSGIDKSIISDLMRHYDSKTLQHYDAIFPDEMLKEAIGRL
ncbi:MAG: site-specific integrase [Phaeodactylibacter sp.]|nr:site-specific integrase [Phaeodactylibacter sp.]